MRRQDFFKKIKVIEKISEARSKMFKSEKLAKIEEARETKRSISKKIKK